jgi:uncharacterized membrane protein YeaQ/YmgE (transglycosylase-associated protein family)
MTVQWILGWLFSGFLFSLLAVWIFRRDGTSRRKGELYLGVLGPLFGPVILGLIVVDMIKVYRVRNNVSEPEPLG